MTYLLIHQGELVPLGRLLREDILLDQMADLRDWEMVIQQIDWEDPAIMKHWTPDKEAPIDIPSLFSESDFFSVGFHGMMDAYNFDIDRARRCCVHELALDGRLIPFCLYNIKRGFI